MTETTCRALALTARCPLRVAVLGRSRSWVADLTAMANAVSGAAGTRVVFVPDTIDWDSDTDLREKLDTYRARLVFQTASLQSPWEFLGVTEETRWKELVWEAGNAIILPMQVALVKRVAELVRSADQAPLLVNACFPDWVNPILRHLGLPISCGIGNVAMFASCLKAHYPTERLQVVGHLYHFFKILGTNHSEVDGPRVWIDDREVPDVERTLKPVFHDLRSVNARGKLVNEIVGAVSAEVLLALLSDSVIATHVPGPNGLPGGYPVRIGAGRVELDLPDGCDEAAAVALNSQGAYDMGAGVIDADGFSRFSSTAEGLLKPYTPRFAAGFHIDELDQACAELTALRATLERRPARSRR
ncbi:hypothetical protein [Kitasatospora sp. MAP5-34]|uniref:hypothetical protein n=1 Tax=Kitasatospora sp. MAP5-34 TaxID=3035102 RepID=UPI00247576A4|nr:hypothetical protein [Kitasatospora sp. MAP5-34]